MNDQTQKFDDGKTDPLLLEVDLLEALEAVNHVLDYGVQKYGTRGGWKGVEMARYNAAGRRHRRARDAGEWRDAESKLPHLAHEICNLLFQLQTAIETGETDD